MNLCRRTPQVGAIKYYLLDRPSRTQGLEAAKDGDRLSRVVYHHVFVTAPSKDIPLCA